MIKISELFIYPIKSCAGISVDSVKLAPTGFELDRKWMIVDQKGLFVTQRENPKLALIQPTLSGDRIQLTAPNMPPIEMTMESKGENIVVEIFGERMLARGTDKALDNWISQFLGSPHKLVEHDTALYFRKGGVQYPQRDEAPTSFVDNYGILVVSQASFDELNTRLETPTLMNRFRPNIVLTGLEAHDEDFLASAKISDVNLRFIDVCYRCNLTTIDQEKAEFEAEPLATLSSYRKTPQGINFGSYAAVDKGVDKEIQVNQEVITTLNF